MAAQAMAPSRPRGRPKGSGIDDRDVLSDLRALMGAEPGLKPTTALKRLGIENPSAIRRLRDKWKETPVPVAVAPRARPADPPATVPQPPPVSKPVATPPPAQSETDPRIAEAFLQAFMKSGPIRPSAERGPPEPPPPRPEPRPAQSQASRPPPMWPPFMQAAMPPNPFAAMGAPPGFPFPGLPSPFAGFPSFLQPFQQPTTAPAAGAPGARQLEAMKLAVEAMTAIARLQLHVVENTMAYSPLSAMLQGQTMMGQMLVAAFTGQLDALKKRGGA